MRKQVLLIPIIVLIGLVGTGCTYIQERTLLDDLKFRPAEKVQRVNVNRISRMPPVAEEAAGLVSAEYNNEFYSVTIADIPDRIIVVQKQSRTLTVCQNGSPIAEYPVSLNNDLDDCFSPQDRQTPEGVYVLDRFNENGVWGPEMHLNTVIKARDLYYSQIPMEYRRLDDFESALGRRILNETDVQAFNRKYPDQKLLTGISIHGGGSGRQEWIDGSIALSDEDAASLLRLIRKNPNGGFGTVVVIED